MKRCDKCNVDVRGAVSLCPLCQSQLAGCGGNSLYPIVPTLYSQFKLFFKLLILFTVSGGVICAAVNLLLPDTGIWSLFVAIGIAVFWISLVSALKMRGNLFQYVTFQGLELSLMCVALDVITGWNGWSLDYVVPIICSAVMLSLAVIAKVMRQPPKDYLVYVMIDVLFGTVSAVFFFTGILSVTIPTVLCMTFSVITLVALILFEGRNLRDEIVKLFHI